MTSRKPLRIAHFSDTHLGYRALGKTDPDTGRNQRAVDFERAFTAVVDDILRQNVDLVIHSGDVFHHTRPSWPALRCFIRQMRRLEQAKLPVVVIAGNHDTPRLRTNGSAFSVLELALPDIRFIAGYEAEQFPLDELNLTVAAVPHGALTNPDPPLVLPQPETRNILVTHGMVPGLIPKTGREPGEEELSEGLLNAGFDYVALGHYHVWGGQGHRAWYAGSTERTGWGDEDVTPGYLIVELADSDDEPLPKHIDLPTRPMLRLRAIDGEGRTARELADLILERAKILDAPEAMVRVELRDTPRPIRRETEAIVRRESASIVWSLQVYSPADVLATLGQAAIEAQIPDLREQFAQFVIEQEEQQRYDKEFAAAFRERGDRALVEAMQLIEQLAATEDPTA